MRQDFPFRLGSLLIAVQLSWSGGPTTALGAEEPTAPPVNFVRDVRPILSKHCFACHGPDEAHRKADLRLDVEASAKGTAAKPGAVVAGKPDDSELFQRIISTDDETRMPPPKSGPPLAPPLSPTHDG